MRLTPSVWTNTQTTLVRGNAGVWNLTYPLIMEEKQLRQTLQQLAHDVVRNEIMNEHVLTEQLPFSQDELGAKMREIDHYLKANTDWHNRFPGLFP